MSTWQTRGLQLSTRLRLGYDLIDMNGCGSWEGLTDKILEQRPRLPRKRVEDAVRAWHEAMYDAVEGTAEFGRRNRGQIKGQHLRILAGENPSGSSEQIDEGGSGRS